MKNKKEYIWFIILLILSFGTVIVSGVQYWTTRGKPPVEKKRITEKVTEEEFPSPEELLKVEGELTISDEDVEIEEGIVFTFQYHDFAWGKVNYGFYIDHQGKIFLYDFSDQLSGETLEEYIESIYNVAETEQVGKISQEELQYYYKMLMEMNDEARMAESSGELLSDVASTVIYGIRREKVEELGRLICNRVQVLDDDYAKTIYKWLMNLEETIPWNKDEIPLSKEWDLEKGKGFYD